MLNIVLSPSSSALADRVRPDPTRPWYIEAGAALSYPSTTYGAGDTVLLNINRDQLGPFTARTLLWSASAPIQAKVTTGGVTLPLPNTLTGSITLPRSLDSPVVTIEAAVTATFTLLNSSLSDDGLISTASPSAIMNGVASPYQGTPVVVAETPLPSALFATDLITAAGATLITSTAGMIRRLQVHIAGNSAQTTAGNNRITITAGSATGPVVWAATPYVPATALSTRGDIYEVDLGSGVSYSSLYLNVGSAFTAGGVEAAGWG